MKAKSNDLVELLVPGTEVREQLRLLVASEQFKGSKRCLAFLEYVVHQRLSNYGENLREKVIGVEAFGRNAGYDSNDDPVVRVTAGEVRKRLAQYYQHPKHAGELRVELVAGSYVPEFHLPQATVKAPPPLPEPPTLSPPRPPLRRPWIAVAILSSLVFAAGLAWRTGHLGGPSAFERFWEPSLSAHGPILLCTGQSRVYSIRKELAIEVESALDPRKTGRPAHNLPPGITLGPQDLIPAWDRYVPLGDAVSMANLAIFLERRHREYRVRGSADTRLTDLREGAAVLFGAFSNDWTLRMNKDLRFHLELAPNGRRYVLDREGPHGLQPWIGPLVNGPLEAEYNDYAILTRIFDKTTGYPVISIGGITHLGTQAGGEFLLSSAQMNEALAQAPPGWEAKNLQIVIATKVIGSSASPPQFLALHAW